LKWTFANASKLGIDTSRVSIGGLSAGGHIAAVLAFLARDDPQMPPLKLQLLVVPAVDARWVPLEGPAPADCPYETYRTCEFAPCLPLHRMRWFSRLWIGSDPEERKKKAESYLASPILAESHKDLAPCSIHCAEFDVLRDEAIAYDRLLNHSGTKSKIKVYEGVCHPWGHWDGELEKAKEYVRSTIEDLRETHTVAS
jgi:acetyl esterase/lipase